MGLFKNKGPKLSDFVIAAVFEKSLTCDVCGYEIFESRRYKLQTNTTEALGSVFAEDALTLVCGRCGRLLEFAEQNSVNTRRIPYAEDGQLDLAAARQRPPDA